MTDDQKPAEQQADSDAQDDLDVTDEAAEGVVGGGSVSDVIKGLGEGLSSAGRKG